MTLPYTVPGPTRAVLEITSQGCADIGVCYPPQKKEIVLELGGSGQSRTQAPSSGTIDSATRSSLAAGP